MLLTSAILGATSLAAILVLFQIRQSSNLGGSTRAIYAADSGIECILYEKAKETLDPPEVPNYTNCGTSASASGRVSLDNGAYYFVENNDPKFKAVGRYGLSSRAFEVSF